MRPFFFGESAAPLYGVWGYPERRSPGAPSALLIPPFGIEGMRSHRAYRQLMALLVRAGIPALRFDPTGTGDSAGEAFEMSIARWTTDVEAAIEEVEALGGGPHPVLVGLRMGGLVAALVSQRIPGIDRIVLWDPVRSGREEVLELTRREVMGGARAGASFVDGFPFPHSLRRDLLTVDLATALPRVRRIDLVLSADAGGWEGVASRWRRSGVETRIHTVPHEGNWREGDRLGSLLLPHAIIREVARCVSTP